MKRVVALALGLGGCIIQQVPAPVEQPETAAAEPAEAPATTRPYVVQGIGFVCGLAGRGDSAGTITAVYTPDERNRAEIQARDWALVSVSAQIPAGARAGDRFTVQVASMGEAQSLAGGRLFTTDLKLATDPSIKLGQASGALVLEGGTATSGAVTSGGVLQSIPAPR